ncbi:10914_t:CDS:2 [Acaulospora colombiana]|uniref:10914_t:CDS:1 n=1 Tax=Acaulospora colombiana TaxID=27376 RepID=A0ACA9MIT5_9GLOM|nr:10914_t:CDS:2 [Acaulospora colombiana]
MYSIVPSLTSSESLADLSFGACTPQPRSNPCLVSQVLQHQIPSANLTTSNFISNNNALSPLVEVLATTTPSMHGRAVFQFTQEQEIRALMDHYRTTFLYHLFLTPSSADVDIPTIVAVFWLALEPAERRDWEELARDICSVHAQLIDLFGNGVIFDGNLWEERKRYHVRSVYLKWVGYQALHRLDINVDPISHTKVRDKDSIGNTATGPSQVDLGHCNRDTKEDI